MPSAARQRKGDRYTDLSNALCFSHDACTADDSDYTECDCSACTEATDTRAEDAAEDQSPALTSKFTCFEVATFTMRSSTGAPCILSLQQNLQLQRHMFIEVCVSLSLGHHDDVCRLQVLCCPCHSSNFR